MYYTYQWCIYLTVRLLQFSALRTTKKNHLIHSKSSRTVLPEFLHIQGSTIISHRFWDHFTGFPLRNELYLKCCWLLSKLCMILHHNICQNCCTGTLLMYMNFVQETSACFTSHLSKLRHSVFVVSNSQRHIYGIACRLSWKRWKILTVSRKLWKRTSLIESIYRHFMWVTWRYWATVWLAGLPKMAPYKNVAHHHHHQRRHTQPGRVAGARTVLGDVIHDQVELLELALTSVTLYATR